MDDHTPTVTGQVLGQGVGIRACLEALRPNWKTARVSCGFQLNATVRYDAAWESRGCGMDVGILSLPNPSTVRIGLKHDGRIALHQGAVDIGQDRTRSVTQICADALGAPIDRFDLLSGIPPSPRIAARPRLRVQTLVPEKLRRWRCKAAACNS